MQISIYLDSILAQKALRQNGIVNESMMAMEETAELAKEISKLHRKHKFTKRITNAESFVNELADVLITANMIAIHYGIDLTEMLPDAIEAKEAEINRKLEA